MRKMSKKNWYAFEALPLQIKSNRTVCGGILSLSLSLLHDFLNEIGYRVTPQIWPKGIFKLINQNWGRIELRKMNLQNKKIKYIYSPKQKFLLGAILNGQN